MPLLPPFSLHAVTAALVLALAQPAAAQPAPGRGNAAPKSVGTVTAEASEVPQIVTLPGRAVAYETATVRPRVGGLVEAITYEPGRLIEAGAPMFRLETATLDAALAAAQAAETGATQARDNAKTTVARYRALENKGVTRADLQAAEVALTQAEAALVKAGADRQVAELDRQRATITAPITGFTSETTTTIGSFVTANQADALATVTRIDPVYVDVAASSARMLEGRQKIRSGQMTRMDPPRIALTLEDGTTYDQPGEIVSSGSTVSATTGAVDLRMKFTNPDRMILPGQFLRVGMTIGTVRAVLVPQRATTRLADGSLAVFVVEDGRARRVTLTEAGVWNNAWAVTSGVEAGDSVIVDGLSNLNDGQAVAAVPVTLDEKGVVVGKADSPADAAPVAPRAQAPTGWRAWLASAKKAVGLGGGDPAVEGAGRGAAATGEAAGSAAGAARGGAAGAGAAGADSAASGTGAPASGASGPASDTPAAGAAASSSAGPAAAPPAPPTGGGS